MENMNETRLPNGTAAAPGARLDAEAAHSESAGRRWLARIPVKSTHRIVIVPVATIVRLEAEDNYVRLWADRPYLHKDTLTHLMSRLDPESFVRIHRSHAVNVAAVRELRPQLHSEFLIILANGTELTSGRSYRASIQEAFGLN
jgi:two-component system LytT family response regulator